MYIEKLMEPITTNKLGAFPVTQQLLGAGIIVLGIAEIIANVAKLALRGIQNSFEKGKAAPNEHKIKILTKDMRYAKGGIKDGLLETMVGVITMIPIVATVIHGYAWNRRAKNL